MSGACSDRRRHGSLRAPIHNASICSPFKSLHLNVSYSGIFRILCNDIRSVVRNIDLVDRVWHTGKWPKKICPSMQTDITGSTRTSFVKQTWGGMWGAVAGSFAAVVFGTVILLLSIVAVTDPARVSPHEGEAVVSEGGAVAEVEYYLPYPGVLPDSPLYKLKAVRDRIVLWVTFGEEKKAQKELLMADKRINAAVFLVEGGKEALGVTTATKAEKYMEQAIRRTVKLAREEKDVKSMLGTLITASAKHMEILASLQEAADGERKDVVAETYKLTSAVHEEAEQALREYK